MSKYERVLWALALLVVLALAAGSGGVLALGGGGDFPDRLIAVRGGEQLEYVPVGAPTTATPTHWWTATPSATLIPTNTPRPTMTPWSATPTQETVTWTPQPTATAVSKCEVKVFLYNVRFRAAPSLGGTQLGWLYQGYEQRIDAAEVADGYLWGRSVHEGRTGWFAIYAYADGGTWWSHGVSGAATTCVDVPGWPAELGNPPVDEYVPTATPTPPPVSGAPALGVHAVAGTNGRELVQFYHALSAKGVRSGVKAVNEPQLCRDAQANGQVCVFRSVHPHDCPPLPSGVPSIPDPDPRQTARYWLDAVAPYVLGQGVRPDYVELTNECAMDRLDWWNAFMLEAVQEARRRGWPPLVLPTLPPGHGDAAMIQALRPALEALRDAGGCFGVHAYNNINIPGEVRLVDGDIWVAYRHRLIHAAMVGAGVGDLPLCITEAARGNGGLPPDEVDFAAWYGSIRQDSYVKFVFMWTGGAPHPWEDANLNGHMLRIAELVEG